MLIVVASAQTMTIVHFNQTEDNINNRIIKYAHNHDNYMRESFYIKSTINKVNNLGS